MNFGQMIGWVCNEANPNYLAVAPTQINGIVRRILSLKTWYGTWIKGQAVCPQAVSTGQATVTLGSNTITGTGTSWDINLVGRQFRVGLNNPIYTIIDVNPVTQTLTIELPWGGPFPPGVTTQTTGYNIVQMYYNIGPNIKYIKTMVNVMLGYKMRLNWTQDLLNKLDPWRIWVNFPCAIAPLPADPNGNYLVEMWPAPFASQALPFTAYVQPPNLVDDNDSLPPYIRCDVVVKEAMAAALRYRPKNNPYYSEAAALSLANTYHQEFIAMLEGMWNEDENLYRTSSTIEYEDYPDFIPGGNLYAAMHAILGDSIGDWI